MMEKLPVCQTLYEGTTERGIILLQQEIELWHLYLWTYFITMKIFVKVQTCDTQMVFIDP